MAEGQRAVETYEDFSFAFNNKDQSNRVLTLHWFAPLRGGRGEEESSQPREKFSETLYVNTAILGKESEYFRAYFSSGFVETWQVAGSQDPRGIHVEDRDCMLLLLKAIYAGGHLAPDACEDTTTLLQLLMLSDEYRVSSVMSSCSRALQRNPMTLALAVVVLTLPQHIQESDHTRGLIAQARRFIEKAFPDLDGQVASSGSEFWSLPLQALECLLASPRVKVQSEDTVFFLVLEWAKRNLPRHGSTSKVETTGGEKLAGARFGDEATSGSTSPACNAVTAGAKGASKEEAAEEEKVGVVSHDTELANWATTGGQSREEALRRLWALVRLPQMSGECLLAIRRFEDAAQHIAVARIEEALRVKMMDPRGVGLLYGSLPAYVPRPGKRPGPAQLVWAVSEKEIMELSGIEVRESSDRVLVCGNWYCIELRKTGLGTMFDNRVVIRLAERDGGPPGHPFVSIKGKRVVEASCTVGTPSRSRVSKGSCQLVCFGSDVPLHQSPPKPETKLNPNPNPNLGELTVGSKLWGPHTKDAIYAFGPKLNELKWDLDSQRYTHPIIGSVFDDSGMLQISIAFQPLSAWV